MVHYSFDDVLWIFKDLTMYENEYTTIFDNSLLRWLQEMHKRYDVSFDLYVFYNAWYNFALSDTTDKYSSEFQENADWLKFGFHGYGFDESNKDRCYSRDKSLRLVADFEFVTNELRRITSDYNITNVLRLTQFSGNRKGMEMLRSKYGVKTFLSSDKSGRLSYYLNRLQDKKLVRKGYLYDDICQIAFYKTTIRVETEEDVELKIQKLKDNKMPIVVFCHEWAFLDNTEICQERFETCFKLICENV